VKTRDLTVLALFAALLSALEIFLGNFLHLLHFPFTGHLLVGLDLVCYLVLKRQLPWKGSVLLAGLLVAIIRFLGFPGFAFFPSLAIFLEAGLVELVFLFFGTGLTGALVGGVLTGYFVLAFRAFGFFFLVYLGRAGSEAPPFSDWSRLFGAGFLLWFLIFFPLISGLIWGFFAYKLAAYISKALGNSSQVKIKN
jgi:hypothetical protein